MGLFGGSGGDGGAAVKERQRQANVDQGMSQIDRQFSGYDDSFYNKRKQAYEDFANPQVQDQYRTTKNNLAYTLARNGLNGSSAATNENAALDKNLAVQQGNIANAANGQANSLRQEVQGQRTNLTSQLLASGDPSQIAGASAAATANLKAPSVFQPLSNLFSDFTNTYMANQNAKAYDPSVSSVWQQLGGQH